MNPADEALGASSDEDPGALVGLTFAPLCLQSAIAGVTFTLAGFIVRAAVVSHGA